MGHDEDLPVPATGSPGKEATVVGCDIAARRVVFDYKRDMPRLQRFLTRMRDQFGQGAYLHLGDLLWRIHYPPNGFGASSDLPIWEDSSGEIAGFGLYLRAQENPEFQLDPAYYATKRCAGTRQPWPTSGQSRLTSQPSLFVRRWVFVSLASISAGSVARH